MAMRPPPMPSLNVSRRTKILLTVGAILVVLLIAASSLSGVYVNWLWFGSVGYHSVYRTVFVTRLALFWIFGILMALILGANLVIAYLLRPPFRPMSPEQQNLERYRVMLEPRKRLILLVVCGIGLFTAGMAAQSQWATWQLWLHGGSFHQTDPLFHRDISFFAWDYPIYRLLLGFGFTAIIFSILLSAALHYLTGAIRLQTPGPKVMPAARRHLTILFFIFMLLKAGAYWMDRYGLVFSHRAILTGAGYTDVHASLPSKTILFWIAIVIAIAILASLWMRSPLIPVIGFVAMLVLSILISGIYPALLQQISVKPNASSKEAPYITYNINATRQAYGIVTGTNVTYPSYNVNSSPPTGALLPQDPTVANIRILDPNQLTQTFTQQQQIKNVFGFASKLDVDRYTVSGTEKDYIVGVRELDASNLNGNQTNWINQHTVYTHGLGFVAAAADVDVTNNSSLYTEANIPTVGPLGLRQSEAYYGELLPGYSIVGAGGLPQEYNGSDAKGADQKITYAGGGGVSLGSFIHRLAFAVNYKETNFVLNSTVSAPGAKIIFNRDPRQMVKKVAPYLSVDGDPYPFIDSASGDVMWMVDAYTTMNNYPYSERNSLSDLTQSSLSKTGKTASQPNDSINYIRNSVKATVDAYTGKVTLYKWDTADPIVNAWAKIFPGTLQPASSMPQSVLAHVRYPEDLFGVQRALLGSYHVTNPVTFYNVGDKWTVPTDPADPTANQPPYYVLASPPPGNSTSAQFQLTTPMIVNSKQNLSAYISVDSDPGPDYGKITALVVPNGTVTRGPEQIANILSTNSVITKDLSLFNTAGGGSTVVHGNLLTLPIGNSFLYVEPLYIQAAQGNGSYPTLQRVLVVYGDKIGYAPTLSAALQNLNDNFVGRDLTAPIGGNSGNTQIGGNTPSSTPTSPGSSATSTTAPPASVDAVLAQLDQAFASLQAAYQSGDPVKVGQAEAKIKTLSAQYLQLRNGGSPSTTPTSPTPSGKSSSH